MISEGGRTAWHHAQRSVLRIADTGSHVVAPDVPAVEGAEMLLPGAATDADDTDDGLGLLHHRRTARTATGRHAE